MKEIIVLQDREYVSRKMLQMLFDMDYSTISKWAKTGLLPNPVMLGNRHFYDRQEIETRILATSKT